MDKYLGGDGDIDEVLAPVEEMPSRVEGPREAFRSETPFISLKERLSTFKAVELSMEEQLAVEEAERCLRCDLAYHPEKYQVDIRKCIFCGLCVESCPHDALFLGHLYEQATYRNRELILEKEDMKRDEKVPPSGYYHPEIAENLPKQTLLVYKDKGKRKA